MKIRPTKGQVQVKIDPVKTKTNSGLLLIQNDEHKPVEATVEALGDIEKNISVGDRVFFQSAAAKMIEFNDQEFHFVDEEYILGVKKNDKEFYSPPEDAIYVQKLEKGEQKTRTGIIITEDGMTERGIRPRWAQIWKSGEKWKTDLPEGSWICLEHGNWSNIFKLENSNGEKVEFQIIEKKSILRGGLLIKDDMPEHLVEYGITG